MVGKVTALSLVAVHIIKREFLDALVRTLSPLSPLISAEGRKHTHNHPSQRLEV